METNIVSIDIPSTINGTKILTDVAAVPKTRRQLLYSLWYGFKISDVNIWKEGPLYAVQIGTFIHATNVRALPNMNMGNWINFINNGRAVQQT